MCVHVHRQLFRSAARNFSGNSRVRRSVASTVTRRAHLLVEFGRLLRSLARGRTILIIHNQPSPQTTMADGADNSDTLVRADVIFRVFTHLYGLRKNLARKTHVVSSPIHRPSLRIDRTFNVNRSHGTHDAPVKSFHICRSTTEWKPAFVCGVSCRFKIARATPRIRITYKNICTYF